MGIKNDLISSFTYIQLVKLCSAIVRQTAENLWPKLHALLGPVYIILQGAIHVLTYRKYANITVWYFNLCFQPRTTYMYLLLSAYLLFSGTLHMTFPSPRYIMYLRCLCMKHDWTDMALRNVGVDCLYMQLCFFFFLVV